MPHDDFQIEPIRGLPEVPPEGERILWQGSPSWFAMARDAFKLYWVAGYFALMAAWRFLDVGDRTGWSSEGVGIGLTGAFALLVLGALTCGILTLIAWSQAATAVYTITTHRVAMRIGAALTVTLNLPYKWIGAVDLAQKRDGTGSIAMQLMGETRLSYLVCWPHVRPWRMSRTEPCLRSIPDAEKVAKLLAEAAEARLTEIALRPGARAASAPAAHAAAPANPNAVAAE